MNQKRVKVAIVGLGFGAEFIPIYQKHPGAQMYAVCQRNAERLQKIGDTFGVQQRYTRYEDVLADPNVDFVHINSPIPDHAWMSIAALKAGKHVLCTVPMATTVEECRQIVDLVRQTGLKYMMAETVVYSREFLFLKELYQKGELGKIQYLAASHPQDMDGWPEYWQRMIPMHYATHVVSPCLGLMNSRAEYVSCFGSGTVREDIRTEVGQSVRRRILPHRDQGLGCRRPHLAVPVRHGSAVSRELRRVRHEAELRMDARRGPIAHPAHGQEARVGNPGARGGAGLRPSAARTDPSVHAVDPGLRTPLVHPGSRPRRLASAPGQRIRQCADPGTRSVAQRRAVGQLDLRRVVRHESAMAGGKIVRLPEFTLA